MKKQKLGELLVERGHLAAENLDWALNEQHNKTLLLGDLLLTSNLVTRENLAHALEGLLNTKYVNARIADVDPPALKLVPQAVAVRNCALPLFRQGKQLVVVMANPHNLHSLDELRFASGMSIAPRLGFRDEINVAIQSAYRKTGLELKLKTLEIEESEALDFETPIANSDYSTQDDLEELKSAENNVRTPAVRIVSTIIAKAARERASDIHVDPQQGGAVVRIRVDGMLRDIMEIPLDLRASLISRIKILGDMDIAEKRAPQDGRLLVRIGQSKIDLRVSTLPTQHGEKAVMRLLDPKSTTVTFPELGFSESTANALGRILSQPQGMLLITGPTGSGKTTTLYAALNKLRTRTKNVITVEDPIEYMLEGINQVQVNAKAGRTFVTCLRSILRQDPNVIMVGEIRDVETAEIGLSASQTGHMVLSTLHTNDSVSAIVRLLDLGIPAFLIASSVTAVIAQRLLRRLCACRKQEPITPEFAALVLSAGIENFGSTMYSPVGCPNCQNTGYSGRVGVYEILFVNEQTRSAIRSGANPDEVRRMARSEGMRLMLEEALDKASSGLVSLEEVFRVIPFEVIPSAVKCATCHRDAALSFLFCPHCGAHRKAAADQKATADVPAGREVPA